MKTNFIALFILVSVFSFSQAFNGKDDQKLGIGATLADGGTGINFTYDKGLGENISIGTSGTYLLGVKEVNYVENDEVKKGHGNFYERVDVKFRFNVHLSDVINVDEKLDVYPGINIGLHNLGVHTGIRYFFTDGFGLFSEFGIPIAVYDKNLVFDYFDGFVANIGVSLNL
ncbi:MAG: hypothetical protein H6604_02165 [Flavobacteriales bacterium]|nr:hypothetical protein [Flavobacteriales bacterium]